MNVREEARLFAIPIVHDGVRYGAIVSAVSLDPCEETGRVTAERELLTRIVQPLVDNACRYGAPRSTSRSFATGRSRWSTCLTTSRRPGGRVRAHLRARYARARGGDGARSRTGATPRAEARAKRRGDITVSADEAGGRFSLRLPAGRAIVMSVLYGRPDVRIAIVSDYYYPQLGGITEHVHGQATELARRGHDVTVVTPRLVHVPRTVDGHDLPARAFDLVHVGRAWPFYVNGGETLLSLGPHIPRELGRLFAARSFDIVHVHNPFGGVLPLAATLRSAAATVGTLHSVVPDGYPVLRMLHGQVERVLQKLDARVAVSGAVVESIGRFCPELDFRTIPNGIDTDFFSPAAAPIGGVPGKRTILFVGRFDPRNGVKTMIHAFARLRPRRDDVRLVVVGDGPLRPLVERLVPAEIRADVHFAGRVNRLRPRYLAGAEILCTPCSLASFGMVLLEGMSSGLPVVASRLPGFELVMRDGIDGVMVDHAEGEAGFAAALDRLLDDPSGARRMGAAGRERALSAFSWKVVVDRLEALYQELLGRDRSLSRLGEAA